MHRAALTNARGSGVAGVIYKNIPAFKKAMGR